MAAAEDGNVLLDEEKMAREVGPGTVRLGPPSAVTYGAGLRSVALSGAGAERLFPGQGAPRLRQEWGAVAVLLMVAVALPASIAAATHSLTIPRNDDWSYHKDLLELARTGSFKLDGWGAMTLVGQLVWSLAFVAVLGTHPWVPNVSVAALSCLGVTAAYWLGRLQLTKKMAVVCVLLVIGAPGFLLNTTSYMTDLPAFSAAMICLALGVSGLSRQGRGRCALLLACIAVGLFGFSVREFDVAAPLSVLVVGAARDSSHRRWYALAGLFLALACAAIYGGASSLPGAQKSSFGLPGNQTLQTVVAMYFTLAFALSPLVPLLWRRRRRSGVVRAAGTALTTAFVGAVLMARQGSVFTLASYLGRQGVAGDAILNGGRPDLFDRPLWGLLNVTAVLSGAALAGLMVALPVGEMARRWLVLSPPKAVTVTFAAVDGFVLLTYALFVRESFFDRYLMALILVLAVVAASCCGRGHRRTFPDVTGPAYMLAGIAALSVAVAAGFTTLNADAYDGAAWSAGLTAVRLGVPASEVDAGFAWVGAHSRAVAIAGRRVPGSPRYETWYDQMFRGTGPGLCAVVSASPLHAAGLSYVGEAHYDLLAFAVPERLLLYRRDAPGCPSNW